ncbi:jg25902, partial [Pararge aegeria aegeria]
MCENTAGDESAEAMVVPGAAARRGGLVAPHQLAQQL